MCSVPRQAANRQSRPRGQVARPSGSPSFMWRRSVNPHSEPMSAKSSGNRAPTAISSIRCIGGSGRPSPRDGRGAWHSPASKRRGLFLRRSRRSRHPRARAPSSISLTGDPARVERRLDMSDSGRTPPSHRARRAWTKTIPLSSAFSGSTRSYEVRADGQAERRAVEGPRARRT